MELLDHDSFSEYRVTWSRRVNGATAPYIRVVSINPATGDVFALVDIHRDYGNPEAPAVSRDQAVAIAKRELEPTARLVSSDLAVVFSPKGVQGLAWNLQFVEGDEGGYSIGRFVAIDALSGQLLPGNHAHHAHYAFDLQEGNRIGPSHKCQTMAWSRSPFRPCGNRLGGCVLMDPVGPQSGLLHWLRSDQASGPGTASSVARRHCSTIHSSLIKRRQSLSKFSGVS